MRLPLALVIVPKSCWLDMSFVGFDQVFWLNRSKTSSRKSALTRSWKGIPLVTAIFVRTVENARVAPFRRGAFPNGSAKGSVLRWKAAVL